MLRRPGTDFFNRSGGGAVGELKRRIAVELVGVEGEKGSGSRHRRLRKGGLFLGCLIAGVQTSFKAKGSCWRAGEGLQAGRSWGVVLARQGAPSPLKESFPSLRLSCRLKPINWLEFCLCPFLFKSFLMAKSWPCLSMPRLRAPAWTSSRRLMRPRRWRLASAL